MRTVVAAGSWPGEAEGNIAWADGRRTWSREPVADRPGAILRFRAELARAVSDLESWADLQPTLEGRMLLQGYKEALLEDAWSGRTCALIDTDGLPAAAAALGAADAVAKVMTRSDALQERAGHLKAVALWLAGRLEPRPLPAGAVLAARTLTPLELLDSSHPVLLAGPEPVVRGKGGPVAWGVPGLGPEWSGWRVFINSGVVTVGLPEPRWWQLDGQALNGHPLCTLNGDPEAIGRMSRKLGKRPAVLIHRLDDLAAVPLFAAQAAVIAIDLDRLGPAPRLKHPGVQLLLEAAVKAAKAAGVPASVGGESAVKQEEHWFSLGFTALFGMNIPRGGKLTHVVRRSSESGL